MKTRLAFIVILFLFSIKSIAQPPQAISYQAVARDNGGNVVSNQNISIRFSIRNLSSGGTIVYQETQNVTTNGLGQFNINIGEGSVVLGTFSTINWSSGSKFLQVELDIAGGSSFVNMGTQQMLSVPYALYANSSGTGGTVTSITAGAGLSGGTITTSGTISLPNVGTTGTFGSASQVPIITTDTKGRVSSITTSPISVIETDPQVSSATTNKIPKWNGTTLGDGTIFDNGNIGVGTTSPAAKLDVLGTMKIFDGTQGIGKILTSDLNGLASWQRGGWSLSGNTGNLSSDFLGTTDAQPLRIKVNNNKAGIIDYDYPRNTTLGFRTLNALSIGAVDNTAIGYSAMENNTTGGLNTVIGAYALQSNTTGNYNTAVGTYVMTLNTTGYGNTGLGYLALHDDTTGTNNTALGYAALSSNTNGSSNTAAGTGVLSSNTTGYANTAAGSNANAHNTTGYENTSIGSSSLLFNTIGSDNIAVGDSALYRNQDGNMNTAVGGDAMYFNTVGDNNTALGYRAMSIQFSGDNNTAVGYNATVGPGQFSNATAVGANANVSANDAVVLGNNANVGIRTSAPKSALEVIGAIGMKVKTALASGIDQPDNTAGIWMYTSGSGTIILPAAISCPNRMYVIVNQTASSKSITNYKDFSSTNVNTIAANSSLWLVSDGSFWWLIK